MTRMIFVRHGESTGNLDGRFYGNFNGPLTDRGREQARLAAEFLKDTHIDAAYASDLSRAYETGEIIAAPHGLVPVPENGLREVFAGEWENMPFTELPVRFAADFSVWMTDIGKSRPTGGESVAELAERVRETVWRIAEANPGKTVLIASHATPIRAMQCDWAGVGIDGMQNIRYVRNASVSIVDYDTDAHTVSPVMVDEAGFLGSLVTELPKNV